MATVTVRAEEDEDQWLDGLDGAGQADEQLWQAQPRDLKRIKVLPPTQIPTNREELARCLADPEWRVFSGCLYQIIVKGEETKNEKGEAVDDGDSFVMPFKPNEAQKRFIRRLWNRNLILKARQMGFCVSPETRVLTAGLEWIAIGDIQPGTEVIACDEHPPGGRGAARKMRTATVQAVKTMKAERFRITFDDGREVVCTDRHPWLSRKVASDAKWRSICGEGNEVTGKLRVGTQVRWITKPWEAPTFDDGWFGGMLDGEGSIAKKNSSAGVNVSQRHGPVWDRLLKYAKTRGYNACVESDKAERTSKHGKVPVPKLAFGRMDEMFRLIGQTRPTRFIDNRFWEGRDLPGKRNGDVGWATITSIEPIGVGDVVDMQTSTGTYIAEGFVSHNTTLIAIMWLDHALFNGNQRCGMIAQDRETAEAIFRDKVVFAYDHMPEEIRERFPLARASTKELLFAHNNSSLRVATSVRGGTIHSLHVSEFGKICAKSPQKAVEVVTGSFQAVPLSGIIVVESTAEGQDGEFYKMCQRAQALVAGAGRLTAGQYRFHFYAWWQDPGYTIDPVGVFVSAEQHDYFNEIESVMDCKIDPGQRAWYVEKLKNDFADNEEQMWREYPSTPLEAFQQSIAGNYYAKDMMLLRKRGGICRVPVLDLPVFTFWDIGRSDGTAIWFMQTIRNEDRFIGYYEEHNEDLRHYAVELQRRGFIYGGHFLPHDAGHKRLSDYNKSTKEMLQALLPGQTFIVLPVISQLITGVNTTRKHLKSAYFDTEATKQGIERVSNYRKKWSTADARYMDDTPDKSNGCSEGADSLRQWAQAKELGLIASMADQSSYQEAPAPDWRM